MAWIESHQDLRTNPKAKRLARILDVPLPQAIGHLHMLWWWALDHAFDGNLGRVDPYDLADAMGWEGDPDKLVDALVDCGPSDRAGFIERAASGHLVLHDWLEYTAPMRAKRAASEKAHHTRWHENRGEPDPNCRFCDATAMPTQSDRTADAMPTQSGRNASGNAPEPEPGPTGTNQTDQPPAHAPDDFPPPPTSQPHDEGGGSPIQQQPQDPDVDYAQRSIGRLPDRVRRKLDDDTPRRIGALSSALREARSVGISPGKVYAALNAAPALDAGSESIAAVATKRIRNLVGEAVKEPAR